MKKLKAVLNLVLVLTISLSGCTQKQVVVQNPQLKSDNKSAQAETSSEQNPEVVRSVSRVSGIEYSDTMGRMGSSAPEMVMLKSSLRENPDDAEARERLAELCFSKGAYITALEHYKELALQLPDDSEIQLALAKTWHELRNNTSSLLHVKRALELDSRSVDAYKLLGRLYSDDSDFVKAERAFLAGLQVAPSDAELLSAVGQTLVELEQAQQALGFLESALALNPELQEARKSLAVVKVLLGDQQGGLEQLMQLYQPAEAYSRLGTIYLEEERWTQAQGLFERALELDPNLGAAAWNLSIAESYISPPSVVAIPAFGEAEMRLAQEHIESGARQENALALNEDLRLPVANGLHESMVDLPGFGGSAPRVADLRTPAPLDVLMDEGAGLWTDEVMSLPRDSRSGEEFLVFQPETKAHKTDVSATHPKGILTVASLSEPVRVNQTDSAPLPGIDSQDYLVLSEVYAVVAIPPFEEVTRAIENPEEVTSADQQTPLAVHSSVEPEAVHVGLQRAAVPESVEMDEALAPLSQDVEPVRPAVVSPATISESASPLDEGVLQLQPEPVNVVAESMQPERESSGIEQQGRQETVTQGALYDDEADANGPSESRSIESKTVAELHRVSRMSTRLYWAEAEPIALDARDSRPDFSFGPPEAKPGFLSTQEFDSLAPTISYSAEKNPGDADIASASVFSLDSDDFGDGGVLPEDLGSQLAMGQPELAPVPGVPANSSVRGGESVVAEAQTLKKAEIVAMTTPADKEGTIQSPGSAQTEAASVESRAQVEQPAAAIETVTTEADAIVSNESPIGEESTTQERKLAGVAWAFLFAGLLSMFLAMGIHLSRRRTTRTSTSEA